MADIEGLGDRGADWVGSTTAYVLAWGLPAAIVVAASLLEPPARAAVWSLALIWMGVACLANARRCGRTHCRYTGPYYLALIVPVALLGFGALPFATALWWLLCFAILLGGKAIWWVTETRWGRYTTVP